MNTYRNSQKSGFTLIELLVVIAIIGLLASVVLASLNSARAKARDARRLADLKQVQLALELYYDTNGTYPWHGSGNGWPSKASEYRLAQYEELLPYLPTIPLDPTHGDTTAGYRYLPNTGQSVGNVTGYTIRAQLEDGGVCRVGVMPGYASWDAAYNPCY